MYNSIIVEGIDGSGKSTFIDKVINETDLTCYHAGGPPKTREEALERIRETHKMSTERNMIFDRHVAISEPIYGGVLRDQSHITPYESNAAICDLNPLILYCRPEPNFLLNRRTAIIEKAYKSNKHISMVNLKYVQILAAYDVALAEIEKAGHLMVQFNPFNARLAEHILTSIVHEAKGDFYVRYNNSQESE